MAWQDDAKTALDRIAKDAATVKTAIANNVSTPTTPPPTGETTPPSTSTGFKGRTNPSSSWKKVFEDDFLTNSNEGSFLSTYKNWGAYPKDYLTTDRKNHYEPNILSVVDSNMVMRLQPGNKTSDGKAWGAAPYPKLPGKSDSSSLYKRFAARVYCPNPKSGWTPAWLEWPDSENWPHDGEIDFAEGGLTGTIGHNTHFMNGTSGGDQDAYDSGVPWNQWNVIVMEWSQGRLFYSVTPDGQSAKTHTVTSRVPSTPMHTVMQTEPTGTPTEECKLLVDWVTTWLPV